MDAGRGASWWATRITVTLYFRYIYADTQKELTAKLRQHIDLCQGVDLTEWSRMTMSEL